MSLTSSSFTMMCLSVDVFLFILTGMHRTSWSIYVCFIYNAKASDYVNHNKLENSERDGNTRPPEIPPDKPGYGRTDWVQIEKEYVKAVYCHPTYLTSMWSSSWEMLDWKKHKLESRFLGEISITSDMKMTAHLRQKVKKTKELLDKSERGEWKSWLKAQHSEN